MITGFADRATEDVFRGLKSQYARRVLPLVLWNIAAKKLDQLNAAVLVGDMRVPFGNKLEKLTADRVGQFSIRINQQYRICFRFSGGNASDVEIVDYH